MERKRIFVLTLITFIVFSNVVFVARAQEDNEDVRVLGLELDKLIAMVNALLSIFLFVVAFIAYKRDGRKRLFYVSLAFPLFAVKSFLISSEIFLPEVGWVDPVATVLEFTVLLSFFYGVLKK